MRLVEFRYELAAARGLVPQCEAALPATVPPALNRNVALLSEDLNSVRIGRQVPLQELNGPNTGQVAPIVTGLEALRGGGGASVGASVSASAGGLNGPALARPAPPAQPAVAASVAAGDQPSQQPISDHSAAVIRVTGVGLDPPLVDDVRWLIDCAEKQPQTQRAIFSLLFKRPIGKKPVVALKSVTLLHAVMRDSKDFVHLIAANDGFMSWVEREWSRDEAAKNAHREHADCFPAAEPSVYAHLIRRKALFYRDYAAAFSTNWTVLPGGEQGLQSGHGVCLGAILDILATATALVNELANALDKARVVKAFALPQLTDELQSATDAAAYVHGLMERGPAWDTTGQRLQASIEQTHAALATVEAKRVDIGIPSGVVLGRSPFPRSRKGSDGDGVQEGKKDGKKKKSKKKKKRNVSDDGSGDGSGGDSAVISKEEELERRRKQDEADGIEQVIDVRPERAERERERESRAARKKVHVDSQGESSTAPASKRASSPSDDAANGVEDDGPGLSKKQSKKEAKKEAKRQAKKSEQLKSRRDLSASDSDSLSDSSGSTSDSSSDDERAENRRKRKTSAIAKSKKVGKAATTDGNEDSDRRKGSGRRRENLDDVGTVPSKEERAKADRRAKPSRSRPVASAAVPVASNDVADEAPRGSAAALAAAASGRKTPRMDRRYEIEPHEVKFGDQVGSGGFGVVFRGKFRGEIVAIKKIHSQALSNPASIAEFQSEVAVLCTLEHPNVLKFMGACVKPPNLMIITEFMARGTLFDVLHRSQMKVTWPMRRSMALDTAKGIRYLHDSKLLHRDLKSSNLMLDDNFKCAVGDFGLTRISSGAIAAQMTGQCGTFQYMAPEILRSKPYSEKADVFSFGILLWELVARKLPFFGMQPMQVGIAVAQQGMRPTMPPKIPPPLAKLIKACWHEDPNRRPSMAQVQELLTKMPDS